MLSTSSAGRYTDRVRDGRSPRHRLDILADTWWYGLSRRWTRAQFASLAERRADQGFDAVQLVAGIPPEVGPAHPDAASEVGAAWRLSGRRNEAYLELARDRLELLCKLQLRPIVYGGWGPQVEWIGVPRMKRWWTELARTCSGLDVVFCLCGEVDLHCDRPRALLPDRSSSTVPPLSISARVIRRATRLALPGKRPDAAKRNRVRAWRQVLRHARREVGKPLLVHTTSATTAFELFGDDPDLAANSTQTGHNHAARKLLYERPTRHRRDYGGRPFVNLEPWYEGIRDSFGMSDQLFAFWASKLAGSTGHVYGAQGVWNLGDGRFLSHWGTQTLQTATALPTPSLLGSLHRWFREHRIGEMEPFIRRGDDGRAIAIGRRDARRAVELLLEVPSAGNAVLDLQGVAADAWTSPALIIQGLPAPAVETDS